MRHTNNLQVGQLRYAAVASEWDERHAGTTVAMNVAWVPGIRGSMKSDYRYSNNLVYNLPRGHGRLCRTSSGHRCGGDVIAAGERRSGQSAAIPIGGMWFSVDGTDFVLW